MPMPSRRHLCTTLPLSNQALVLTAGVSFAILETTPRVVEPVETTPGGRACRDHTPGVRPCRDHTRVGRACQDHTPGGRARRDHRLARGRCGASDRGTSHQPGDVVALFARDLTPVRLVAVDLA